MAIGLGAYALLLCLLVAAEAGREGATIDSLPRAVWYSLVTLTTVGYGDLYPVSPLGRAVGGVFLLLSTGLLALLIGLIFSAVTGRLYPRLALWRNRMRRWYVFSADNPASRALAAGLDDGLIVFLGDGPKGRALRLNVSPEALFSLPFVGRGERVFFAMDEDEAANEAAALALGDAPARIYCRGDGLDEGLPGNVVRFSECECAARLYWQKRPWAPQGERVALVGDGKCARALLDEGLLTAPPGCALSMFGNWSLWRSVHAAVLALPEGAPTLEFPGDPWQARGEALRGADRIVLCADSAGDNREALSLLRRYYPATGPVDVRCPAGFGDAFCFGEAGEVFAPELVMRQSLNRRARQLHELYRAKAGGPAWEALSDFAKRSNLAAADHLLTKLRLLLPEEDVREITPEACARAADRFETASPEARERFRAIEHDRWTLFHALYNWRYGAARDNDAREHPMMVAYDRLDEAERRKDDSAWEQLRLLSEGEKL